MDLAEVNGQVSSTTCRSGSTPRSSSRPEYRDTKADTTLSALPKVLGPGSKPLDLRFAGSRTVTHHDGAHVVQVSNGPVRHDARHHDRPPRSTPASWGSSRWCCPTTPPLGGSSPRWPRAAPTGTRGSRSGRAVNSSSTRAARSPWGSTARRWRWSRHCGSPSARMCCGYASRRADRLLARGAGCSQPVPARPGAWRSGGQS